MSFVGIDIGGTFLKAALLDSHGVTGPVIRRPTPEFIDATDAAREIDPGILIAEVFDLLELVTHGQKSISGILVTGQMASLTLVDDSGTAVAPIISWQDSRFQSVEDVGQRLGPSALAALGDGLRIGSPLVALSELNLPESVRVTSLIGFVAGSVAGIRAPVLHMTDAAALGLVDVAGSKWSQEATAVANLTLRQLPGLTSLVEPIGRAGDYDCMVFCAVADQQAALLGSGLRESEVSVNLATGCQVAVITSEPSSPRQLRPYFGRKYLQTVTHLPAGRILNSALLESCGSTTPEDWSWAASEGLGDPRVAAAIDRIVGGIVQAVDDLGVGDLPVRMSGGLIQQFAPVRNRLQESLGGSTTVFSGEDAALMGLAMLADGVSP
jgi:sugar (pentulose or hexulose) kinase